MSETAQQMFDSLKSIKNAVLAVAPGLKDIGPEVGAELKRLTTQGSMELASALFNGDAFVPYGPGQYTPDVEAPAQEQSQVQEQGQEHDQVWGRER